MSESGEAVQQGFRALIDAEEGAPASEPTAETASEPEAETPEEPTEPEAESPEAGESESEPEAEAAGAETEESEAEAEEEAEAPRLYTVKVQGQTFEVDEDELIRGYQRGSDYSRKTTDLASQRNAFQAERTQLQQGYRAEMERLGQTIETLEGQLAERTPEQWAELKRDDPSQYALEQVQLRERKEEIAAARAQQAESLRAVARANLPMEQARLLEKIPEWGDAEKAKGEFQKLGPYLRDQGVDASLAEMMDYDHRLVAAFVKAMRYDEMIRSRPVVEQKVRRLPKVVKPGTKGPKVDSAARRTQELRADLKRTGSPKAAQAAFRHLLEEEFRAEEPKPPV